MSLQDIRQNPQDTSNFYLANIYQAIADPNPANISALPSPPQFTAPTFAVWVNGLWFLSLVISITCALLATLLQQWARRYLKATQPRYSLHKRARMRSFFAEGFEKSLLPLAVEALPALLHLSLFLFFAGLGVFLCNVDLTIFKLVLSWIGVCTALYGCITLIPIFRRDSPYYTPLTPLARPIAVVTLKGFLVTREVFFYLYSYLMVLLCHHSHYGLSPSSSNFPRARHRRFSFILDFEPDFPRDRLKRVLKMMLMTPEEAALDASPLIDTRAFMWTLDRLDEDHELERFFSSLPDFRNSKVVHDPLRHLTEEEKEKISETLFRFLIFTLSSNLLPAAIKSQRAIICAKALDLAQFSPLNHNIFREIMMSGGTRRMRNIDIGPIMESSPTDQPVFVKEIATWILARPPQRDDSWFRQVAPNALGVSETVLRDYAANGDSLSLVVLIHVTRQQFTYFRYPSWPISLVADMLLGDCKFNVRNTLPELQHEFCTLWNEIVLIAQENDDWTMAEWILKPIRNIYVALHHDTNSAPTQFSVSTDIWDDILSLPSSYPVCKVADHVHVNSPLTSSARTIPHDPTAIPPSLASPDILPSSTPVPLHVIESPTDVLLLDDTHPAQATIEGPRNLVLSADLPTANVMQDFDTSDATAPLPAPETSTAAPLFSSPPSAVSLQHNTDQLTPPNTPNLPSIASLNPVLDAMLPTGPSLSSHSPITRPSSSPSFPESHR